MNCHMDTVRVQSPYTKGKWCSAPVGRRVLCPYTRKPMIVFYYTYESFGDGRMSVPIAHKWTKAGGK